jgi:hypothetical protein
MHFTTLFIVFGNNRAIAGKDIFRFASLLLFIFGLVLVTGCNLVSARSQRNEARRSLDELVNHDLPQIEGLETIEIVSFTSSRTEHSQTCHYATDYLIIGASMPEEAALERYVAGAESMGWIEERRRQYDTTKLLIQGDHARLVVNIGGRPGADIEDAIDYEQAREVYQSLLFVSVDFMLPQRDGC